MHRVNKTGIVRVSLYLLAESRDRKVNRTRVRKIWITPHFPEQFVSVDDTLSTLGKILQQLDFTMCHMQRQPAFGRLLRPEVDRDRPEDQMLNARAASPEHGLNARQEFLEIKGLRDVVVGPEAEPTEFVRLLATSRQDDDWCTPAAPQPTAQIETIRIRQHDVEHDKIGREFANLRKGGFARLGANDLEPQKDEIIVQ